MSVVRMRRGALALGVMALVGLAPAAPSWACDGGEAPVSCGAGDGEGAARWMLLRAAAAVQADKAQALRRFAKGEAGFRTEDTYVFCIGPDAVLTAHPDALLQGRDVSGLRDGAGRVFVTAMLGAARPGQISRMASPFSGTATFYTRAGDQVCGTGRYDAGEQLAAAAAPLREMQAHLRLGAAADLR